MTFQLTASYPWPQGNRRSSPCVPYGGYVRPSGVHVEPKQAARNTHTRTHSQTQRALHNVSSRRVTFGEGDVSERSFGPRRKKKSEKGGYLFVLFSFCSILKSVPSASVVAGLTAFLPRCGHVVAYLLGNARTPPGGKCSPRAPRSVCACAATLTRDADVRWSHYTAAANVTGFLRAGLSEIITFAL